MANESKMQGAKSDRRSPIGRGRRAAKTLPDPLLPLPQDRPTAWAENPESKPAESQQTAGQHAEVPLAVPAGTQPGHGSAEEIKHNVDNTTEILYNFSCNVGLLPAEQQPHSPLSETPEPTSPTASPRSELIRRANEGAEEIANARRKAADHLRPAIRSFLESSPAIDFLAKHQAAEFVNDVLGGVGCQLTHGGFPCRLKAEQRSAEDQVGIWVLERTDASGQMIGEGHSVEKLPAFNVDAIPESTPYQAREEVRRGVDATKTQQTRSADDLFAPLVAAAYASKAELAEQLLEPLKERLRAMPHESLEAKRAIAGWLNSQLRDLGLHCRCPKTGNAATLVARPARNKSRFSFHFRDDQGRSHQPFNTTEFEELMAVLALIPSPLRTTSHSLPR